MDRSIPSRYGCGIFPRIPFSRPGFGRFHVLFVIFFGQFSTIGSGEGDVCTNNGDGCHESTDIFILYFGWAVGVV